MKLPDQSDWDKLYTPNGKFTTKQMFFETSRTEKREAHPPIFTLKPRDYNGLPSAYLVYMDSVDEYDAALKLVPNMKVWDLLKEASWFLNGLPAHSFDGLVSWRDHMKQRDASAARAALMRQMDSGNTTAAKAVLADTKTKAPVGRKGKKTVGESASVTRMKAFKAKQKGNK